MPQYSWKRFWCPRESAYNLLDDGYLLDPDGENTRYLTRNLSAIEAFEESPCLVMLGEPGIGKSTEFEREVRRVQKAAGTDDVVVHCDLKEYATDESIANGAFDKEMIKQWKARSHVLYLMLDSLDEGQLEVKNIAAVLNRHLRPLAKHADRLRIRIACRSAEWPISLEDTLRDIWPDQAVEVVHLVPLRRMDVAAAADAEDIDSNAFLDQIDQADAVPLANRPVTLGFLLGIFKESGEFPATKYELYERGCLHLCREFNQSRHDAGHLGQLEPAQRLEIAGRIAATAVFCNRASIDTSTQVNSTTDALTVSELAGVRERVDDTEEFRVSELAVAETLSTALFVGHGPQRLAFAHRTYAEFLAARYLTRRDLDETQIRSLLFHPEHKNHIIPQLAETAAWLSLTNEGVCQCVLASDPTVLLRSDVATAKYDLKRAIIDRLLLVIDSWEFGSPGRPADYAKLAHADLADQLAPVLRDKTKEIETRRFAGDVAEGCRATDLLGVMMDVVLDQSDNLRIRASLASAIVGIGDEEAILRLKPLAFGQAGPDPEDQLRGWALRGLWPRRLISANELFRSMTPPQGDTHLLAYWWFFHRVFDKHLKADDLPAGLRWCRLLLRHGRLSRGLKSAVDTIVGESLSNLDHPGVVEAFARYIRSAVIRRREVPVPSGAFASVSETDRRRILTSLVSRLSRLEDPEEYILPICYREVLFVAHGDFEWLIEQSNAAVEPTARFVWARIARYRVPDGGGVRYDWLREQCQTNPILDDVFSDLLDPVDLNSEEAKAARERYASTLEQQQRIKARHEKTPLDPPPAERIQASLDRFKAGNLDAWWHLNRDLQLEEHGRDYPLDLYADLTEYPGWKTSDEPTQQRILAAARQYLEKWTSSPEEWIGTNSLPRRDSAGYRAIVLVEKLSPEFLESLSEERWRNAAPVILGFPDNSGIEKNSEKTQPKLVALAYPRAPEATIEAMITLIDRENARKDWDHLYVLRRIEQCWDARMLAALTEKARDERLTPSILRDLLAELIHQGSDNATAHAHALLRSRADETAKELACNAAFVLWLNAEDHGWSALWPEFQNDQAFFEEAMINIAHEPGESREPPTDLADEQLGELYILLAQTFPPAEDLPHDRADHTGPRDSVQRYRDNVLIALRDRGTEAACTVIDRIQRTLPEVDLRWVVHAAKREMLQETWRPVLPDQLRELTRQSGSRLVRNGQELQRVVLESLARLQDRLHGETPSVRDIWDKDSSDEWRPVDENDFSDYVKRHLAADLKSLGIVALREVEIRRGHFNPGERTDIYIAATIRGRRPGAYETVTVIVEAKGCWHRELKTAMETQLKDRYLRDNGCEHGIYLVGWFACDAWTQSDSRCKATPKWTIEEARNVFRQQAEELSEDTAKLEPTVIEASLR